MQGLPFMGPGTPTDCDLMMELNDTCPEPRLSSRSPPGRSIRPGVFDFLTAWSRCTSGLIRTDGATVWMFGPKTDCQWSEYRKIIGSALGPPYANLCDEHFHLHLGTAPPFASLSRSEPIPLKLSDIAIASLLRLLRNGEGCLLAPPAQMSSLTRRFRLLIC